MKINLKVIQRRCFLSHRYPVARYLPLAYNREEATQQLSLAYVRNERGKKANTYNPYHTHFQNTTLTQETIAAELFHNHKYANYKGLNLFFEMRSYSLSLTSIIFSPLFGVIRLTYLNSFSKFIFRPFLRSGVRPMWSCEKSK